MLSLESACVFKIMWKRGTKRSLNKLIAYQSFQLYPIKFGFKLEVRIGAYCVSFNN